MSWKIVTDPLTFGLTFITCVTVVWNQQSEHPPENWGYSAGRNITLLTSVSLGNE